MALCWITWGAIMLRAGKGIVRLWPKDFEAIEVLG